MVNALRKYCVVFFSLLGLLLSFAGEFGKIEELEDFVARSDFFTLRRKVEIVSNLIGYRILQERYRNDPSWLEDEEGLNALLDIASSLYSLGLVEFKSKCVELGREIQRRHMEIQASGTLEKGAEIRCSFVYPWKGEWYRLGGDEYALLLLSVDNPSKYFVEVKQFNAVLLLRDGTKVSWLNPSALGAKNPTRHAFSELLPFTTTTKSLIFPKVDLRDVVAVEVEVNGETGYAIFWNNWE